MDTHLPQLGTALFPQAPVHLASGGGSGLLEKPRRCSGVITAVRRAARAPAAAIRGGWSLLEGLHPWARPEAVRPAAAQASPPAKSTTRAGRCTRQMECTGSTARRLGAPGGPSSHTSGRSQPAARQRGACGRQSSAVAASPFYAAAAACAACRLAASPPDLEAASARAVGPRRARPAPIFFTDRAARARRAGCLDWARTASFA